jgi:HAE1 family hydrophobic/amphiphilic exporter-1
MFLSNLSIQRPIFATVMMLTLLTLGIFSYRRLPVDMFPDVEIPVISIITKYPGASPETVEREVSKRIEEAVNPIAGVKHVISSSREGVSNVIVQFHLEVRINEASQEARAKINAIRGALPQGIEDPIIQKLDFSAFPIISLAVRSSSLSPRALTTLVEKRVKRRMENIPGVGKVDLVGASKREVNVNINPIRLEALRMGVDEIIHGLQSENVNTPLGRLHHERSEYPLRISGKPELVEQFQAMVIARRNGRPIPLSEVAQIQDGIEEQRSLALVNGIPAIGLDIMKQSGANTVEVVDRVKREIEALKAEIPAGVEIEVVRDGSIFIRESVRDVQETILLGGFLTILIVFCFLNSWRSTIITGLTLPISVISSFIVMNFMGMTLNVLTLMALSLAIGLLIDDAIVVRENIVRHLEKGEDHFTAAREGTSEIGLAVLATTLSIVAVFIPVAYMRGIVGRFFFSFGITVTFAVLVSLFVSFTLDPMLSSRWLDPDIGRTEKRFLLYRILDRFNRGFERLADIYQEIIGWALRHRGSVIILALISFFLGTVLFIRLETNFFPEADQGEFQVAFKAAPEASIEETRDRLGVMLGILKKFPEVQHTYATIGAGDAGTLRDGRIYIKLVDRKDRKRRQEEIQKDLRQRLQEVAGIIPSISEAGRITGEKPINVSIRGEEIPLLKEYSARLKKEMLRIAGLVDLEVALEFDIPEIRLIVDREKAADAGVMTADISRTLAVLVGGQAVSTYEDEDGDAVNVRVRLPEGLRQDPAQVQRLRISVAQPGGLPSLIPLGNLIHYTMRESPSEIRRRDLSREVMITANLEGLYLGTAIEKIRHLVGHLQMAPGYRVIYSGEAEDMAESFGYLTEALLLAVIMVYLILAAQFESFLAPLAIMFSLPLSIVGMAGMLHLTGDTINIMSLIGLIMLMGLVTKNAILLIDFTRARRSQGLDRSSALILAGRIRLRPIMMTTFAMIFGMLPLALAIGAGAEMRAPMARAVVGGLMTSTVLTLIVVPVVYTLLDDFGAWVRRRWQGKEEGGA